MERNAIIERILSDADEEAKMIVLDAERQKKEAISCANARAAEEKQALIKELEERAKAIREGKEATARLDSAKQLLKEKRRVIDVIYSRALQKLLSLGEKKSLEFAEKLLSEYASEGDEIVFAENYPYAEGVRALPVVKKLGLKLSQKRLPLSGGFVLYGKTSDTDISYGALLKEDREQYQSELAQQLFKEQV